MQETTTLLGGWESFYVIVGTSAAALTGLQFVVIALVAEVQRRSSSREIDAFGTPNVVHFAAVLFVSAVLSAPWTAMTGADLLLGATGLTGVGYVAIVARRARTTTGYRPVLEDWLWHVAFPLVAYAAILSAAVELEGHTEPSLFTVGAAAVLLLFIGIHNAWDTVTWVALTRVEASGDGTAPGGAAAPAPEAGARPEARVEPRV